MNSFTLSALENKRQKIHNVAVDITRFYINDGRLRNSFTYSENQLACYYIAEYKLGHLSFGESTSRLNDQLKILQERHFELMTGRMKIYALAQREKSNSSMKIILKQVGFVGGGLQVFGGYGICNASLGLACASIGVPMIVHGKENMWENAYYLVLRQNPSSAPLRESYRYIASLLGGNARHADIAYSAVDLTLSAGAAFKYGLKPDAWKLFRYIQEDYIIGWKTMSAAGLSTELVADSATGYSLYQIFNENEQALSEQTEINN